MDYLAAILTDTVVVVTLLIMGALVLLALWCWAAARNVKALDRELEAARVYAAMAMLREPSLDWFKEELHRPISPRSGADDSLFLVMQIVWPEDTTRLTAEWAAETDPGEEENGQ